MKNKVLGFILSCAMLFGISSLAACGHKGNSESKESAVQLVSVEGTKREAAPVKPQEKKMAKYAPIVLAANDDEVEPSVDEAVIDTLGYNVLVLPTSATEYDVTINLENTADHSIQDFRLSTNDETLKMYNENQERWDAIDTSKSIKWLGSNNSSFKFSLQSSSEEAATSIKITEILYLNRNTKTVENVNLSTGPDYVDVVKADMPEVTIEDVYYDADKYITAKYSVDWNGVSNVKLGETAVEKGKSYDSRYNESPELSWDIPYKGNVLKGSYSKQVIPTDFTEIYHAEAFAYYVENETWGGVTTGRNGFFIHAMWKDSYRFNLDVVFKVNDLYVNLDYEHMIKNVSDLNPNGYVIAVEFLPEVQSKWEAENNIHLTVDSKVSVELINHDSYVPWFTERINIDE